MMTNLRLLLGLIFASWLCACGGESIGGPDDSADSLSEPVVGGALDPETNGIVGLALDFGQFFNSDFTSGHCSGTLIAPNLVVTAQHCTARSASDPNAPQGAVICGQSGFTSTFPPRILLASTAAVRPRSNTDPTFHRTLEIRAVPGGNDTCGFDVTLLILEDVVSPEDATPVIPRIDSTPARDEAFSAVGYGIEGPNNVGGGTRQRTDGNIVDCAGDDCNTSTVRPTEWVGRSRTCPGDSGGPAIDAEGRVMGVLSRGPPTNCDELGITPFSLYGDIGSWGDFIIETALDAAAIGGYDPPYWAVTGESVPPDEFGDDCTDKCLGPDFHCSDEDGDGAGTCVPRCDPAAGFDTCPPEHECSAAVGACLPIPPPLGEPCNGACRSGYRCYAEAEPPGICVPPCSADGATCPQRFACAEQLGVCVNEGSEVLGNGVDSESSGGCAVASVARPASGDRSTAWLWALAGIGVALSRRRRRA